MSGGEGLRAPGFFPPLAATVADAREAFLSAGGGGADKLRPVASPGGEGDKPRSPRSAGVSVDRLPGLVLCVEAYIRLLRRCKFSHHQKKGGVGGPQPQGSSSLQCYQNDRLLHIKLSTAPLASKVPLSPPHTHTLFCGLIVANKVCRKSGSFN